MAETITSLNDNDVLFGRGTAISKFIGNQNFRDLTEDWKERYIEAAHNKEKSQIAENLYHHIINDKNGRFLRLAEGSRPVELVLEFGEWCKVPKDQCLEKIKQVCIQGWNAVFLCTLFTNPFFPSFPGAKRTAGQASGINY